MESLGVQDTELLLVQPCSFEGVNPRLGLHFTVIT